MAIEKMKRLRLAAVSAQREDILRTLLLLGCVEISEPDALSEQLPETLARAETSALPALRSEHALLLRAIDVLERYAPEKKGFLEPLPEAGVTELLNESELSAELELAEKLDDWEQQVRRIAAEEGRERAQLEALGPWKTLDIPLDCTGTKTTAVLPATLPAAAELNEADRALAEATELAQLLRVSDGRELHYVVLLCLREELDAALAALRPLGFSAADFGGLRGTVQENLTEINRRLSALSAEKTELAAQITAQANRAGALKLRADTLHNKILRAAAQERFLYTEKTFIFLGWLPEASEKALGKALAPYDCVWESEAPDPEETEAPPVKLRSSVLTEPFTMVTSMYSYPAYNGIDPNPFLMPTFCLFFGIMFADVGYGAILVLFGLAMKYVKKARGGAGYLGGLGLWCGLSCMLFGAVTGAFFGDIVYQLSNFFGGSAVFKGLIDPLADPMTILVICLGIGVVHLLLGVTINAYLLLRDGRWRDALWDAGSIYLMFLAVALGALGVSWWGLPVSAAVIVCAQGRGASSLGGKLGSGLYGLYSVVTGWFGDILSYSRLMALLLAGTVIAQVFNTLGAMTGNILAFAVIFAVGHALNFGLNVIGTYVHTSRLEYLEFFGKFYREGGRAFQPLGVRSNYYNIFND